MSLLEADEVALFAVNGYASTLSHVYRNYREAKAILTENERSSKRYRDAAQWPWKSLPPDPPAAR